MDETNNFLKIKNINLFIKFKDAQNGEKMHLENIFVKNYFMVQNDSLNEMIKISFEIKFFTH